MRRVHTSLVLIAFFSLLAAALFNGCKSNDNASLADFAISSGSLEVKTLIEGLNFPMGVGIDVDSKTFKDNVFVADRGAGTVIAVAPDGTSTPLTSSGLSGPGGILFDILPDTFFVLETESNEISRVDFSQQPVVTTVVAALPQGIFPAAITTDGQFRYVAAHDTTKLNNDKIYNISTASPSLVFEGKLSNIAGLAYRLNKDRSEFIVTDSKLGQLLLVKPSDRGEQVSDFEILARDLITPTAVTFGPASSFIYVAETGADRVMRFTADGGDSEPVAKIVAPNALVFDSLGNLFVSSGKEGKVFKVSGLGEALN